ncbi:hypothetical protein ACQEVF_17625 [Nonomuraea polychroma]|uniref:hypothetical protein n=1 Tax=Nonomuraea polychroma TaxID=46176 RepID=UPI003D949952
MAKGVLQHLWRALDFKLSEILQADFVVALLAGTGAVVLSLVSPEALLRAVPVAAGLVGVVIGAVLAGVAVQAAFMDQAFLRKLRAIGKDPNHYLAPFLFTGVTGVFGMLALLPLATMSKDTWPALLSITAAVASFFTVWSLTSILHGLAMLVQFVGLKMDAVDVPDDIDVPRRERASH